MIRIDKSYIVRKKGCSYLCADIIIEFQKTTLWFAVKESEEKYLCIGHADAFVMALLPFAVRNGHEIICEDIMSKRLNYQLNDYLIPSLTFAQKKTKLIRIKAPCSSKKYPNLGAVGTIFGENIGSFYTVMTHRKNCEYPLTHISVFNNGIFQGDQYRESFRKSCCQATRFAEEQGLKMIYVDTNFHELFSDNFDEVSSFRNLSCVFALQGLFSVYLFSSVQDVSEFKLNVEIASYYDLLTMCHASTESLSVYLSGSGEKNVEKNQVVMKWEPAKYWLMYRE